MKKNLLVEICIAIFLIGVIGSVWVLLSPRGSEVQIVQDGDILYRFDLSTMEDQTIDVKYEGRVNTIQIENGRICVSEADCPDQTCVHMGWLESGKLPIVCLPNHLIIKFADTDENVDAVAR